MSALDFPSVSTLDEPAAIDLLADCPTPGVDRDSLEEWASRLFRAVVPDASSFVVRLTDSTAVQELNGRYRGKDEPTDVLSFPGDSTPEGFHLGDVVIAVPVAERQAAEAGHPLESEIRSLIIHGLLHCMGYDHETDDGEMAAREVALHRDWNSADA